MCNAELTMARNSAVNNVYIHLSVDDTESYMLTSGPQKLSEPQKPSGPQKRTRRNAVPLSTFLALTQKCKAPVPPAHTVKVCIPSSTPANFLSESDFPALPIKERKQIPKPPRTTPCALPFAGTPECWMNTEPIHKAVSLPDPEMVRKQSEAALAERRHRERIMQQRLMHMRYEDFDCPEMFGLSSCAPAAQADAIVPPADVKCDDWETIVNELLV
jgi:hypothetical protein